MTKSPLGDTAIELKYLFLVDYLEVFLSSLSLPPCKSFLHSITPLIELASWSHMWIWPFSDVVIKSLPFGWKSVYNTSEL
jgi:hypothetical protein